jgi:hypothetical protein
LKFKTFRPEDLSTPVFKIGLKFEDLSLLRREIKEYACQNRRDIKLPINDLRRVKAVCNGSKTCPCYLWASYDSRPKTWMIKRGIQVSTLVLRNGTLGNLLLIL